MLADGWLAGGLGTEFLGVLFDNGYGALGFRFGLFRNLE